MARRMKPVELSLIEEGRLLKSTDDAVKEAGKKLISHVKKYGAARANKAKAEVTLKLILKVEDADQGTYSVAANLTTKHPGRPISATLLIQDLDQDGAENLFARASGSDEAHPRQKKLCTDDGKAIDPETGEIKE